MRKNTIKDIIVIEGIMINDDDDDDNYYNRRRRGGGRGFFDDLFNFD